jgi:hypothetical protein
MSRGRGTPAGTRQRHELGGSENGPLTLIHRNKVPNPVSMRVSGRLGGANVTLTGYLDSGSISTWLNFFSGPVGGLMAWRAAHAGTS